MPIISRASLPDLHGGIWSCKEFSRSERSSLGRGGGLKTGAWKSRGGHRSHQWAGILHGVHHLLVSTSTTADDGDHVVVVLVPDGFDNVLAAEVGCEVVSTCNVVAQFLRQGFRSNPNFFVSLDYWWLVIKKIET